MQLSNREWGKGCEHSGQVEGAAHLETSIFTAMLTLMVLQSLRNRCSSSVLKPREVLRFPVVLGLHGEPAKLACPPH